MPVFPPATLLNPANEATDVAIPVQFRWVPSHAAPPQPYAPQVLMIALGPNTEDFNSGIQIALDENADNYIVSNLAPNTRYYWRVVNFWDSPESAYSISEVWSFITSTTPGPGPGGGNNWLLLMLLAGAALAVALVGRREEK